MGYDIHITRQENWFDEDDNRNISIDEWKALVTSDPEMRLDNFAEVTTPPGDTLRVENDGLSVWTKYSGDGLKGNHAWFDYRKGTIVVKNPDDEILNKMLDIANKLKAKVQGDESEIYERSSNNKITSRHTDGDKDNKSKIEKPWWKFW